MTVTAHFDQVDAAKRLVMTYHYSHRWPANVQLVTTWHDAGGLFGDFGPAIAALCFSIPPTRWAEEVWELSRLVRHEGTCPPLTGLIAAACREAKQRGAHLLVSFADATHGHHGGIYRAASWHYAGCRPARMDGVTVAGVFVPGRSANSRWGTQSPTRLRAMGIPADPHMDAGKHLYWRALTRIGRRRAKRLALLSLDWTGTTQHAQQHPQ